MSAFSISNQKIDPTRRPAAHKLKPDGSPDDNDRVEIGPTKLAFDEWAARGLTPPNLDALRAYRHKRLVDAIVARGYAGVLMFDPLNIRYATDTTNMQLWIAHNPARACLVLANGHMVLWDFHSCDHLSAHLPLVKELRHGASFFYFESGDRGAEHAAGFAAEVDSILRAHCPGEPRLAIDKIEIAGLRAFDALGYDIREGQELTEHARKIKDANELNAMRCATASCEIAMEEMRAAMVDGVSEDELWSHLHAGNIKRGGEWIETRILASGPRTNPWFQECGPRIMSTGEIMAFDTDLIGPYGYCCDISRTWLVGLDQGEATPTPAQKALYQEAYDHIMTNIEMVKPGVRFEDLTEHGHRLAPQYRDLRYGVMFHGVGLCDEYPSIRYPEDYEGCGYSGVLEPGMCLCVEAYVGAVGGGEGVKLEDQLVVTEGGYETLSTYRFEQAFLS